MAEKINLLASSPASRFIAAAVSLGNAHKAVKGKLVGEVSLTINGVEVPFSYTVNQMYAEFDLAATERAKDMAVHMVTDAGLSEVMGQLATARLAMMEALRSVRKVYPDMEHVEVVEPT